MYYSIPVFEFINTDLLNDSCPGSIDVDALSSYLDSAIIINNAIIEANSRAINSMLSYLTDAAEKPVFSPYKRKYDTVEQILQHLATTSTRKEIASLYYVNADLIQQSEILQNAFIKRKEKFYLKTL